MLAVKLVLLAGMQQHIRQSRHRDHAADRISPAGKRGPENALRAAPARLVQA
jgi:hypothetical protein